MRLLSILIENNDTVWIYCRTEALAESFLQQCEDEGFRALNGHNPASLFLHKFYGISGDMTMGYLSGMIWSLTAQNSDDKHVRVDYEKFISDEEDYTCY